MYAGLKIMRIRHSRTDSDYPTGNKTLSIVSLAAFIRRTESRRKNVANLRFTPLKD